MAEMDKAKFKEGCKEGGGSYVENRDGSFQCNLLKGGTIKCPDTESQCAYQTRIGRAADLVVDLSSRGVMAARGRVDQVAVDSLSELRAPRSSI